VEIQKTAAACEEPARNWIADNRSAFYIQTLDTTQYKIIPKQPKIPISHFPQGFPEKYSACSMKLSPCGVQNTVFVPGVSNILLPREKFKTGPWRF
jgi:hypothetical protein